MRAWRTLQARLAAPPPPRRWLVWPAVALGAGAAAALVVALFPAARPTVPVQTAVPGVPPPPVAVAPPAATTAEPPPVVLSARLRPLSGGPIRLEGGALLSLGHRTRAQGSRQAGKTQLVLESGTLKLAVAPGQPQRGLSVRAGPYRFIDLGTIFRVTRQGRAVSLWVEEGSVAVWRDRHQVATVQAGGHWSSSAARAPVAADGGASG